MYNRIEQIIKHPQTINKNHESLYRCFHILGYVKGYLETHGKILDGKHILSIINFMDEHGKKENKDAN